MHLTLLLLSLLSSVLQSWNTSNLSVDEGLSSTSVTKIIQSSDGYIYFGTQLGVDRYDGRQIIPISIPEANPDLLSIRDLCEDYRGRIWILSDAGICRLNAGEYTASLQSHLGAKVPKRMVGAADGEYIYFVCRDSTMLRLDVRTEIVRQLAEGVKFMCSDLKDRIFYTDIHGDLNLSCISKGDTHHIKISNPRKMQSHGVPSLAGDQPDWSKAIRLRISGDDLFVIFPKFTIIIDLVNYSATYKDFPRMYDVVSPPSRSESYIAAEGIAVMDRNHNEIAAFRNDGTNFIQDNFTNTACVDREGGIWIGTRNTGVYHLSDNFSGLEVIDFYQHLGIKGAYTKGFAWNGDGTICISTVSAGTLSFKRPQILRRTNFAPVQTGKPQTTDEGLKYSLVRENLIRESDGHRETVKTPSQRNIAILLGKDQKTLWVASATAGLWKMRMEDETFEKVEIFKDREGYSVTGITFDSKGYLWGVADRGIFRIGINDGSVRILSEYDGFPTSGFSGAISSLEDGRIYVGMLNGFLSFKPGLISDRFKPNRILFTHFQRLGTGKVESFPIKPVLEESITLPYESNSFSLGVSDLSFATPAVSALQYRVNGLSDHWVDVSDGRITIVNLPHGKYELEVRHNPNYPVNGSLTSLKIKILRHPLASILAFVIYTILIMAIVTLSVLFVKKKDREKAMIENERRAAKSEKELYTSKVNFLSEIASGIGTPLTLIKAISDSLGTKLSRSADASLSSEVEVMSRNIDTISSMVGDFARIGHGEDAEEQLNLIECDIIEVVNNVYRRFALAARTKGLTSEIDVPGDHISASIDKSMFEKIISNLLSNAVRYSSSKFRLSLEFSSSAITVIEENDGRPVPLQLREKIFEPFYQIGIPGGQNSSLSGLGLHIARRLAEEMEGSLSMDDDTSTNRFILTVPVRHIDNIISSIASDSIQKPTVKPLVMIAENNSDLLRHLGSQFERVFSVALFKDGKSAIEYLRSGNNRIPDMLISDIFLPEVNGMDLCREIKSSARTCHIPVILTSSDDSGSTQTLSDNCGADMLLVKPFTMERIFSAINNLLEGRRRLKEHYRLASFDHVPTSAGSRLVKDLDEYLSRNIDRDSLAVEEIAAAVNMSPSSLQKKLKSVVGVGPIEYLNDFRMNRAAQMLENDSISILDISMATGYGSQTYFTKVFKKHFGITPREYRSKIIK